MAESIDRRAVYNRRRKKRRRKILLRRWTVFLLVAALLCGIGIGVHHYRAWKNAENRSAAGGRTIKIPEWIDVQLIHIHSTARTGKELETVKNIVIHYVGNPGSTAQNNRDYFDKDSTEVSSHFVVGLEGEIIQCVPLYERSAASNQRNKDSVSIEVCHPDEGGRFAEATYASVVKLTAWLLHEYGLTEADVIRHYDVTGKLCPLYYVQHEDAWTALKNDIGEQLHGIQNQ